LGFALIAQLLPAASGMNSQKALYASNVTDWGQSGYLVGMPILVTEET